jgi:hypothetical protein
MVADFLVPYRKGHTPVQGLLLRLKEIHAQSAAVVG